MTASPAGADARAPTHGHPQGLIHPASPPEAMDRIRTGSKVLDAALGGGVSPGVALFVAGEEGAGATEFALTALRAAATDGRKARILTALRSPSRVHREIVELFEGKARPIDVRSLHPEGVEDELAEAFDDLDKGDVLVIESADTLIAQGDEHHVLPLWRELADRSQEIGILVVLLHAPGTLPRPVEAALSEEADGVLRFAWHDGGQARRRLLFIPRMRGLAPVLDGEQVPVFEVALERGLGFSVSRERNVL